MIISCDLILKGHIFLLRFEAVLRPIRLIQMPDAEFEQKAAPHMPSGSHIVLISTSQCVQQVVTPPYLLYTASKGAIEQMTRVMSKELLTKGICVNAVAPGPTGTDMFYKGKTEQMLKLIAGFSPTGRIGRPEEVAEVIVWLSGGQSGWVSGQVLRANGGSA